MAAGSSDAISSSASAHSSTYRWTRNGVPAFGSDDTMKSPSTITFGPGTHNQVWS
jgi:hypothetical protein